MVDESGDLRDRFRRSDYRSAPIRPRPITSSGRVNDLGPPTKLFVPSSQTPEVPDFNKLDLSQAKPKPVMAYEEVATTTHLPVELAKPQPMPPLEPSKIQSAHSQIQQRQPQPETNYITQDHQIDTAQHNIQDQPAQHLNEASAVKPKHRRQQKRAQKRAEAKGSSWLAVTTVILFMLAGGSYGAMKYLDIKIAVKKPVVALDTSPIPAAYNSLATGFDVYYAYGLPADYRVAPASYELKDGALTFNINTADGRLIPVSEQQIPAGSTADQLVPAPKEVKVTGVETIDFPGGKSALSKWDDKILTSTVVNKTWIIVNVTNITKEEAIQVTQAFKKL